MFYGNVSSGVFGGADVKLESALKNPNQFREAVICETIRSLPSEKIKEFCTSEEAKAMINEGYITQDTIERLADSCDTGIFKTTVCHMAKEADDPDWDAFVMHQIESRRLMNDMIAKYGDKAKDIADNAQTDFIEHCVPEYFRK